MNQIVDEINSPKDTGLFEALANALPAMIWISDASKKCVWFSRDWLAFTDRTMKQEMGDGWAEGVHPDDLARCLATYVAAFDQREPFEMTYRLRRHDGEYRLILDKGEARFGQGGKFTGYIGGCVDVLAWKAALDDAEKPPARRGGRPSAKPAAPDIHSPDAWVVDLRRRVVRHKTGLVIYLEADPQYSGKFIVRRSNAVDWAKEDHKTRSQIVSSMVKAAVSVFEAARKGGRKS